jgi:hypothetical protein
MKIPLIISLLLVAIITGCGPAPGTGKTPAPTPLTTAPPASKVIPQQTSTVVSMPVPSLKLEDFNGGFFSIRKPVGWDVVTAGACSTFSFCIRDSAHPANRIFYFNEVGPVYLAEEQKTIDKNYMDMGGFPVQWFEMPVINPLTPENFLTNFHFVARTKLAQNFMPGLPDLGDIQVISMAGETSPVPGGQTKTVRALFKQGGELGEGLFYITVAPLLPLTGMPSAGIGYGFCFTGITSVKSDFKYYEQVLTGSLNSLNLSQAYIDNCLRQQQQQWEGVLKAGKTLSETSDIIMEAWENRDRSDDILSEKRSDVMLGRVRVYDPDTGAVYDTPLGFYDKYNINRDKYKMNNLQLLPENDWNLWTAPAEPVNKID